MTEKDLGEMKMWYRQAADKAEIVGILSDMFLCSPMDVCEVLGIELPRKRRKFVRVWDEQSEARLMALCDGTLTTSEIAQDIGFTPLQVRNHIAFLRRCGYQLPVLFSRGGGENDTLL